MINKTYQLAFSTQHNWLYSSHYARYGNMMENIFYTNTAQTADMTAIFHEDCRL